MKKTLQTVFFIFTIMLFPFTGLAQETAAVFQEADLPPNAKPGECFARVLIPERYETNSERVMVREASERIENGTSCISDRSRACYGERGV